MAAQNQEVVPESDDGKMADCKTASASKKRPRIDGDASDDGKKKARRSNTTDQGKPRAESCSGCRGLRENYRELTLVCRSQRKRILSLEEELSITKEKLRLANEKIKQQPKKKPTMLEMVESNKKKIWELLEAGKITEAHVLTQTTNLSLLHGPETCRKNARAQTQSILCRKKEREKQERKAAIKKKRLDAYYSQENNSLNPDSETDPDQIWKTAFNGLKRLVKEHLPKTPQDRAVKMDVAYSASKEVMSKAQSSLMRCPISKVVEEMESRGLEIPEPQINEMDQEKGPPNWLVRDFLKQALFDDEMEDELEEIYGPDHVTEIMESHPKTEPYENSTDAENIKYRQIETRKILQCMAGWAILMLPGGRKSKMEKDADDFGDFMGGVESMKTFQDEFIKQASKAAEMEGDYFILDIQQAIEKAMQDDKDD